MKKRLVFHWFVANKRNVGTFSNTNKRNLRDVERFEALHLNCLKHYSSVFDCATFILAYEPGVTIEDVCELEKKIVACGFLNVRFIVVPNNDFYGECLEWKKIVLENEEHFDGLTFFYHTKGITHEFTNSMVDWTTVLYYFNLEFAKIACEAITNKGSKFVTSGIFLVAGPDDGNTHGYDVDYHYFYCGNASWLNYERLKAYYDSVGKKLEDYKVENRWSSESFYAHAIPLEYAHSVGATATGHVDDYKDCNTHLLSTVGKEAIKGYSDFKYNVALKGITL